MNRRELLKYFSVGTVIAPLAHASMAARIIEPPKLEAVKLIETPIDYGKVKSATVTLEMFDGSVHQLEVGATYTWNAQRWLKIEEFEYQHGSPMTSKKIGEFRGEVAQR